MNIKTLKERTKDLTLLYVEDNEQLSSVKLDMFKDIFKKVVHAENGYEGLLKYQEERFDLIITDINMPVMDGLDMVEKIQKTNANQKVIVLSAYTEFEYLSKLAKLDILCFLTKPVNTKKMLEKIYESTKNAVAA